MKYVIVFILVISVNTLKGQTALYKGLMYDMPIKQARNELKKNKEQYNNISFGDGVNWKVFKQNFVVVNDTLKGLVLKPKGALFGLTNEEGQVYLEKSKVFLQSLGYKIYGEPEYWNIPILFSELNKSGLMLDNEEKNVMIELRAVKISAGNYVVNMGIYNYKNTIKYYSKKAIESEKLKKKSGF